MRNLHLTFDWHYIGQKLGEDFAKFCGLLRIYVWTLISCKIPYNVVFLQFFDKFLICANINFVCDKDDGTIFSAKMFDFFCPFELHICHAVRAIKRFELVLKWNLRLVHVILVGRWMTNDEFSVECLFWSFQPTWKSDPKVVQITKNYLFWVNAPL